MAALVPVESSSIKAVGYDPADRVMMIEFKSGATHKYHEVKADAHAALMAAPSIGKHFHEHVRDKFATSKMEAAGG